MCFVFCLLWFSIVLNCGDTAPEEYDKRNIGYASTEDEDAEGEDTLFLLKFFSAFGAFPICEVGTYKAVEDSTLHTLVA